MSAHASATSTALPAGVWKTDDTHSFANFAVRAVGTFRGSFEVVEATLSVAEDGSASLVGSVVAESIVVKNERLRSHLASADFFDMARYPRLSFASSSLSRNGTDLKLEGELTIRDTTRQVEARGRITEPVTALDGGQRLGLAFETVIDRSQYGVAWNAPMPAGGLVLGEAVKLTVDLDLELVADGE